jgi:hypothetical protein
MKKGYQIVEPRELSLLLSLASSDAFAMLILSWLCERLPQELPEHAHHVEFEVIGVCYISDYPAIGLRYQEQNPQDIGPLVEAAVDRLLRDKPVLDLVKFIEANKVDWKKAVDDLIARSKEVPGKK